MYGLKFHYQVDINCCLLNYNLIIIMIKCSQVKQNPIIATKWEIYQTCFMCNKCDKMGKELSFCHKLKYSYPYIFSTHGHRPQIFQTINSVGSINLSLKHHGFTLSGCRDIEIKKFEFVAKTQVLYQTWFMCNKYSNFRSLTF